MVRARGLAHAKLGLFHKNLSLALHCGILLTVRSTVSDSIWCALGEGVPEDKGERSLERPSARPPRVLLTSRGIVLRLNDCMLKIWLLPNHIRVVYFS